MKEKKNYKGNDYTIYLGGSQYIFILDAGHGGMINGIYQTEGKRSPVWSDGSQLFEGVSNRDLVKRITIMLENECISYINLIDNEKDIPLKDRTDLTNQLIKQYPNKMLYISIHSDAFSSPSAKGWSVYTSLGNTLSDKVAEIFSNHFKIIFPKETLRSDMSDGDSDKEENFWVLRKTNCPAILTENFFMTNERECKDILMNDIQRDKITHLHVDAIIEINNNNLLK